MEDSSPSQHPFSPHPMDFSLSPALPHASSRYPPQNTSYHRPNAFASGSNTLWMDSDSSDRSRSMSSSSSYHASSSLALATADHLFEAGNRAYISAFQEIQVLGAQLKESRNNYSLLLARIHESAGPASSSVSIPGSDLSYDASFLALRSPQNYTKIRFWEQAQYTKASKKSDTSSIVDDDEDDDDDDEGGKKFKGYPWVEDDNGTPMTKANSRALSSHLRSTLVSIGRVKRATTKWSDIDVAAVNYVRAEMYREFPDLSSCRHHWKLTSVLSKVYPSWFRNWAKNGGAVSVKGEPEDILLPPETQDKKRPNISRSKPPPSKRPRLAEPASTQLNPPLDGPAASSPTDMLPPAVPAPSSSTSSASASPPALTLSLPEPSLSAAAVTSAVPAEPAEPATPSVPSPTLAPASALPVSQKNNRKSYTPLNLFSFSDTIPSRVAALNETPQPDPVPGNGTDSSGSAEATTTSGTGTAPVKKRSKDPNAALKASTTNSARNLAVIEYLKTHEAATNGEFENYWDGLDATVKKVFDTQSKAANKLKAKKVKA
ncbi:hypothetical protein DFH09DRAFT_1168515 [Mycena vulgaris]|nr:hypothetical protein DFH09DRAFT_1168515 [Mycena vulgaris]